MEELVGDRSASRPWATHVQAEANANLGLKGLGIPSPSSVPICPCIFHPRARTHHPSSGMMMFKPSYGMLAAYWVFLRALRRPVGQVGAKHTIPIRGHTVRQRGSEKVRNQARNSTAHKHNTQEAQGGELRV